MPSDQPINAVVRAVDLLLALNRRPASTLAQLHKETRIPKSTIVRLLETLGHRGLVRRGPQFGSYQLTALVGSSCRIHRQQLTAPTAVCTPTEVVFPHSDPPGSLRIERAERSQGDPGGRHHPSFSCDAG